jgi:hypothetical protein
VARVKLYFQKTQETFQRRHYMLLKRSKVAELQKRIEERDSLSNAHQNKTLKTLKKCKALKSKLKQSNREQVKIILANAKRRTIETPNRIVTKRHLKKAVSTFIDKEGEPIPYVEDVTRFTETFETLSKNRQFWSENETFEMMGGYAIIKYDQQRGLKPLWAPLYNLFPNRSKGSIRKKAETFIRDPVLKAKMVHFMECWKAVYEEKVKKGELSSDSYFQTLDLPTCLTWLKEKLQISPL